MVRVPSVASAANGFVRVVVLLRLPQNHEGLVEFNGLDLDSARVRVAGDNNEGWWFDSDPRIQGQAFLPNKIYRRDFIVANTGDADIKLRLFSNDGFIVARTQRVVLAAIAVVQSGGAGPGVGAYQ